MPSPQHEFNIARAKYLKEISYISIATFINHVGITRKTFNTNVLPSMPILRLGPRKHLIPESAAIAWVKARTEILSADKQEGVEWEEIDDDY
jgi:hypothetical protein